MKKIISFIVIFALMIIPCAFLFSACGKKEVADVSYSEIETKIREVYALAVDAGYTGTYEEWLASIKGEKGDKGEKGNDGNDASYAVYEVTYNYNYAPSLFKTNKTKDSIKSTEWILSLPEVKDEYKDFFDGWYIKGTDIEIKNYSFIGGNVELVAKVDHFAAKIPGLYKEEKMVMSWDEIKSQYPNTFSDDKIVYDESERLSLGNALDGDLIIDDSIVRIGTNGLSYLPKLENVYILGENLILDNEAFTSCPGLTNLFMPNVYSIGSDVFAGTSNLKTILLSSSFSVGNDAFHFTHFLEKVYYLGSSSSEWNNLLISTTGNEYLTSATRYYYSATEPTGAGNYWHYATDGVTPIIWE